MSSLVERFEAIVKNNLKMHIRVSELAVALYAAKKEIVELKAKAKVKYKRRLALEDQIIKLHNELMSLKSELTSVRDSSSYKTKYQELSAKSESDKEFWQSKVDRLEGKLTDAGLQDPPQLTTEYLAKSKEILDKLLKPFSDEHAISLLMFNLKQDEAYVTRLLKSWKYAHSI